MDTNISGMNTWITHQMDGWNRTFGPNNDLDRADLSMMSHDLIKYPCNLIELLNIFNLIT